MLTLSHSGGPWWSSPISNFIRNPSVLMAMSSRIEFIWLLFLMWDRRSHWYLLRVQFVEERAVGWWHQIPSWISRWLRRVNQLHWDNTKSEGNFHCKDIFTHYDSAYPSYFAVVNIVKYGLCRLEMNCIMIFWSIMQFYHLAIH